ncbi:beta-ketoacyl-ACP synthase II [Nafulsella turpanensis]|uniref:beta-ketoacyl-ACP synthase II n=1 Tax=Nafulsella turpanensis TaxID=1265690 RepID=UPI00034A228A|nr:beta-ketoacyl-ACP synthase II [Nafulsella turpanensis]
MQKPQRVVVTGLGALSPLGNNVADSWNGLLAGKSGAAPITRFNAEKFKTRFACELKNFSATDFLDRKAARTADPFTQYALIAGAEAWTDAGLEEQPLNRQRCGVIWATGNGGVGTFEEEVRDFYLQGEQPRFNPYFVPKMLPDTPSGVLAIRFGLQGINFGTVSACAAANTAIIEAMNYIRWGKADLFICGGSEAPITPAWIGGFNALKALSTRNDSPETASRPLDEERDGFVMGEGAAALVLESYEHAKARGAKIYAEVLGGGMSADAFHATATHPEGEGAALSMQSALDDAELAAEKIGYINLHATSTPVGDLSEIKAVEKVFGQHLTDISLGATKSMTGHLLGAAGALEALICVKALHTGFIPPVVNLEKKDPALPAGLHIPQGEAEQRTIRYAMSNSFGFGGHNATIVLGKAE